MPQKRHSQSTKGGSNTKKAKNKVESKQRSNLSAQDIQDVTLSVIKTLKEQGLVNMSGNAGSEGQISDFTAYNDNLSEASCSSRQYNASGDTEIEFRPVNVASGVLRDLSGGSHFDYSEAIPNVNSCIFKEKSITRSIPGQIRDKIVNNEFIDLSILLPGNRHKSGGAQDRDSAKRFQIRKIEDWTNAFLVYSAIYATRYPESGAALFAYMANIRFLASSVDSLSWLHYDIDFRQARESEPISWAVIDNDLWLKAMVAPRPFRKGGSQQGDSGAPEVRKSGECWAKEKFGSCTKRFCNFKHTCSKCAGEHRGAGCENSIRNGPKNNGTSDATNPN